jgi:hypothetical protein
MFKQRTLNARPKTLLMTAILCLTAILTVTALPLFTAGRGGSAPKARAASGTDTGGITNMALNIGADETQRNVVWYSNSVNAGKAQIAKEEIYLYDNKDAPDPADWIFPTAPTGEGEGPVQARNLWAEFTATSSAAASGGLNSGLYSFKATLSGLNPNTNYVYRVGGADGWSKTYRFSTGKYAMGTEAGGTAWGGNGGSTDGVFNNQYKHFSFIAAGDPQIGADGGGAQRKIDIDSAKWTQTLARAGDWFGDDVDFLITLGDQVESNNNVERSEREYAAFLAPDYLRNVALAPNLGNHDVTADIYKQHYNLPNVSAAHGQSANGGDSNVGNDYWYSYNGVLFMGVNSNNTGAATHDSFIASAIAGFKAANGGADPAWKVVTLHHSPYSGATHAVSDARTHRLNFSPLFAKYDIDVVLGGHDHSYVRSYMMGGAMNGLPDNAGQGSAAITDKSLYGRVGGDDYGSYVKDNAGETLHISANSASGSKFYPLVMPDYGYAAAKNQESTPSFSKVDVTPESVTVTTYRAGAQNTVNGVIDTFTLYRGSAMAPAIKTDALAGGKVGEAYGGALTGTGAPKWSVESGALPGGLSLGADGVVFGTPTAAGAFTVTVKAANDAGESFKTLTVLIVQDGADGLAGANGANGSNGADGAKGEKGDAGETGAQGAKGCGSIAGTGSGFGGGIGGTAATVVALPLIGLLFAVARRARKNGAAKAGKASV